MSTDYDPPPSSIGVRADPGADPYRLLVDAQTDCAVIMLDPAGTVVSWNTGAERIQGCRAEEIIGCPVAIAARQACAVEILNYRKDGTPFWNALSVNPVHDEQGQLAYYVGVQDDVTERKKLEAQLRQAQKMEAIGRLAGGVAHDFNNLLTIISGYSEMLLAQPDMSPALRAPISAIGDAGRRAAALTRQLLAFSRQTILEPRVLDLNAVVSETGTLLRRLIGEDILFTTVLAPNLRRVRVDPGQLDQVLMNLTVNARDAMPTGGRLTIETANVELSPE